MSNEDQNNSGLPNPAELGPPHVDVLIRLCADEMQCNGFKVGIFAAVVCQICGGIGTFSGQIHAMAVHMGPLGEFVCNKCRSGVDNVSRAKAAAQLQQQPYRYCELCRERVSVETDARFGRRWLCQDCLNALRTRQEPVDPGEFLASLVRQRYIWLQFKTTDQLRAFHFRLEVMQLDLEDALAPNEAERERLKATRDQRAEAILARHSREQKGETSDDR